jgi:hypothetical protein
MPSAPLLHWQNDRMIRLTKVDAQCTASLALVPRRPNLVEENLRGYVLLLSAHFQVFCRDLHTEGSQTIVRRVRPSLRSLTLAQYTAHRRLEHGNPNLQNLQVDFERFDLVLDLASADPANPARLQDLAALNRWRNVAAHHGQVPPGMPLTLPLVRTWRLSCDGLASSLDDIMYNELRRILRRRPWCPATTEGLVMAKKKDAVRDPAVAKKNNAPVFKVGDYVKIRYSGLPPARIVELRGPLAPVGVQVYRVCVRETRRPTYNELPEYLLTLVPAEK